MRIGAIIQARMDSSRLPGKVLMPLPFMKGESVLGHIVKRLKYSQNLDEIVIATSKNKNDLPIVNEAERLKVKSFCGSKDDVLERFVGAAEKYNLDVVIRITGDNPIVLIDVLDDVINKHLESKVDYTRNNNLPYGTSFEIVNVKTLKQIHAQLEKENPDREHVTLYIKKHREKYRISEIDYKIEKTLQGIRLTVDYPSDYAMMNILVEHLQSLSRSYNIDDLNKFFKNYTWVRQINEGNLQKKHFDSYIEEKEEAITLLEKAGLSRVALEIKKMQ